MYSEVFNKTLEGWKEWVLVKDLQIKHGFLNIIQRVKPACALKHTYGLVKLGLIILQFTHHVLQ